MQNSKQLKVHLRAEAFRIPIPACHAKSDLVSNDPKKITCKRCLKKLSYKHFKRKLREKLHKAGYNYEMVSPKHATVLCSCPPKQVVKSKICPSCGLPIAQDLEGAIKLRNKGEQR